VWLEIKQRAGLSRSKIRVRFLDAATDIDRAHPDTLDVSAAVSLIRDRGIDVPSWLRPSLALRYSRSRWIEPETGARVALDRVIQPTWVAGPSLPAAHVELRDAIVEFKGTEPEAPPQLRRRLTAFGGRRTSFSKYSRCFDRLFPGTLSDEGEDIR
jgi:hypothetical protein